MSPFPLLALHPCAFPPRKTTCFPSRSPVMQTLTSPPQVPLAEASDFLFTLPISKLSTQTSTSPVRVAYSHIIAANISSSLIYFRISAKFCFARHESTRSPITEPSTSASQVATAKAYELQPTAMRPTCAPAAVAPPIHARTHSLPPKPQRQCFPIFSTSLRRLTEPGSRFAVAFEGGSTHFAP
jgi:hypothetical protein